MLSQNLTRTLQVLTKCVLKKVGRFTDNVERIFFFFFIVFVEMFFEVYSKGRKLKITFEA